MRSESTRHRQVRREVPRIVRSIETSGGTVTQRRATVLLVAFVLLLTILLTAQFKMRVVVGKVVDARGNTLRGAVVQLEDTATLVVRSYITQRDGLYHFSELSEDTDYELRAQYRGHWSDRKTVSKFDSSSRPHVDLTIPID